MKTFLNKFAHAIAMFLAIIIGMFYYYGTPSQWGYGEPLNDDPFGFILAICTFVFTFLIIKETCSK